MVESSMDGKAPSGRLPLALNFKDHRRKRSVIKEIDPHHYGVVSCDIAIADQRLVGGKESALE